MTHETQLSIDRNVRPSALIMGAFLMAALVDASWIGAEKRTRDDRAQLISTQSNKDLSIIALVGNGANGREYARQLGPHLQEYGSTHFVAYPENGFSSESVADKILEAAAIDEGKRKAIFVSSMGEMVFNHLVADPEIALALQPVDYLISNDGVTNLSNLQPKMKRLIQVGSRMPVTKSTAFLYSAVRRTGARKTHQHAPEVTDQQVREHLLSTASTPLYAMSAQWKNMLHYEPLPAGTLSDFGHGIQNKIHITAPNDSVINGDASYKDKVALYGDFERIIDHEMPVGGHAMSVEFPGSIKRILSREQDTTLRDENKLVAA